MNIIVSDSNNGQMTYNIEAFQKDVVSLGRQPDNDIVLNHDFISRVHGAIYREGPDYYIEDLDSTNGLYVNGKRVKKAKLQNGTCVVLARSANDANCVRLSVCENVPAQQPMYGQPVYGQPMYGQQAYGYMLPMTWYKFIIYFQLFASALFLAYLAVVCFRSAVQMDGSGDSMQYLQWADEWLGSRYADSIAAIQVQFYIAGILAVVVAVACVVVRNLLAGFKANALKNFYELNFVIAIVIGFYWAIGIQIVAIENDMDNWIMSGGSSAMDDEVVFAIIVVAFVVMAVAGFYDWLNSLYFNKRKHLFTN